MNLPRRIANRIALCTVAWAIFTLPIEAQTVAPPAPGLTAPAQGKKPIPAKVEAVLKSLDETGKPPNGVLGGRAYENNGREGEQLLPRTDRDGDAIVYHTWDVNPRGQERDRGQERLVVGSDGSAYYTTDYYKSFATVRNPARSQATAPNAKPRPPAPNSSNRNRPANAEKPVVKLDSRVSARVMPVVEYILKHDAPPADTVGGRNFGNFGSEGGEVLPKTDSQGRAIRYREWDVNKKIPGRNRGAERIVTGSDGRVYYTSDHYETFQRIK